MIPAGPAALAPLVADPPLDPTPDEARSSLRRELVRPEYYDDNLLQRLLDWVQRRVDGTVDAASRTEPLVWLAGTTVVLLVVLGVGFLVSRARRSGPRARSDGDVLGTGQASAAELRAAAEQALAEGRHEDAVLDGFRALALLQVERGRLVASPGTTAHEVAASLAGDHPDAAAELAAAADLFDSVMYGARPATADQARGVLAIDDRLRSLR